MKNKNVLICGAGGFIGGHLTKKLLDLGANITAIDIKPLHLWFQKFKGPKNISSDLKLLSNCMKYTKNIDFIFNLACNMGGMGFIENNKAECMISVLINTHLLSAAKKNKIKKYFFSSSACVYNTNLQKNSFIAGLRESDAYPALPEDGYGWEKLFSERMCRHFNEDFNLDVSIARFHNIYGPFGTYDGGREKAPAALCRKISQAKLNKKYEIDIWGDGKQTRSFLYIDDCIDGVLNLFETNHNQPLNIGSEEQVSINELIKKIEKISKIPKLKKIYNLDMPKGVRGRSSDNKNTYKILNWKYKSSLDEGLKFTYDWIEDNLINNNQKNMKYTISKII